MGGDTGDGVNGRNTQGGKNSNSGNAAVSVFLRVRPPGALGADIDKVSGKRTYQILDDQATLRTFPPLSAGHSRTINRQVQRKEVLLEWISILIFY